jgi:hypothetical protein
MPVCSYQNISVFGIHVLQAVKAQVGRVSMRRVGCITGGSIDEVLHEIARVVKLHFDVQVYVKENVCLGSRAAIVAIDWSSCWIYLHFCHRKDRINVIIMYRKQKMEGVHKLWTH